MSKPGPAIVSGTSIGGKYVVERVLGQGGMGAVLLCHHFSLEQRVAIKVLLPRGQEDESGRTRFLREARAAAKLQSHHVARVSDVDVDPVFGPYYVMEYLEGRDLKALLAAGGPLPLEIAVDFVLQAIDAISEAHALGIVHRDLKPANLFLAERNDGTNAVKVIDFGISKTFGLPEAHDLTTTAKVVGSPSYMSPEQVRGSKRVDRRADVWSLGVILYELTTARLPFEADTVPDLFVSLLERSPPPPSAHTPELPLAFDRVVLRCLTKDPEGRFLDVGALATALVPFGTMRTTSCVRRAVTLSAAAVTSSPALSSDARFASDSALTATSSPTPVSGTTATELAVETPPMTLRRDDRRRVPLIVPAIVAAAAIVAGVGFVVARGSSTRPRDDGAIRALGSSTASVVASVPVPSEPPTRASSARVSEAAPDASGGSASTSASASTAIPSAKPSSTKAHRPPADLFERRH